jgi:hypothetical protein
MKTPHQKFIEFMEKSGSIKLDHLGAARCKKAAKGVAAFLISFFCLGNVWGLDVSVSEVSGIDISNRFRTLYKTEGHVEYGIIGESMVQKNQKRLFSRFEWKGTAAEETKKGKYYLIWLGLVESESSGSRGRAKKILFRTPSGNEWNVKAESFEMPDLPDSGYMAIADVGGMMEGKGIYEVRNLETKPDRFGGYIWIGIYENPNVSKRHVELKVGLAKLKPGELYEARVLESGVNGIVSRVSTFGADGKAGNGSSNLLNRMALSGREDWDGSSGDKWDVDSYPIEKFGLISDKGLTWSIDPLLQWLYPAGIVVQIDLTENKGGEKK